MTFTGAPMAVATLDPVRRLLAWPGRWLDRSDITVPHIPVGTRQRWLQAGNTPPEGWLALQAGLGTVGDERAWASFASLGTTALSVGGVHGTDRGQAFRRFRAATSALGFRRQAVYPLRRPDEAAAQAAGFVTLPIGVESWVELDGFTLRGKRYADLRQMRNRARNRGIVVEEVDPGRWKGPLEAAWQAFLEGRREPWRVRWLSGAPDIETPRGRRFFVAHYDREVQAFCTVLPGPEGDAVLDVMCRRPCAQPGSMEALLVGILEACRAQGLRRVSLGPCPLAGNAAQSETGLLGWAFRWAWRSRLGNRWFGFRRLAAFKDKFRPSNEPVQLALAPQVSPLDLYFVARIWALEG